MISTIFDWLGENYKVISGIVVPVLVGIFGIFKVKEYINKSHSVKGKQNSAIMVTGGVENAFNSTVNADNGLLQVVNSKNVTLNLTHADTKSIQQTAETFIATMYPKSEKALEKLRLNSLSFIACLELELQSLSPEELEKFSEADMQVVLQTAIKNASRKPDEDIHQILSKLIADRVRKPKKSIAELAMNESIELVSKLDVNLIKILALNFVFSRTKFTMMPDQNQFLQKLSLITNDFANLELSLPKFEYLEGISCGKVTQFSSSTLITLISSTYLNLFIKQFTDAQISEVSLPTEIINICFIKVGNFYTLHPVVGLHLFEEIQLTLNNCSYSIENPFKEKLIGLIKGNRLTDDEIKYLIVQSVPNFEKILTLWDTGHMPQFSLTSVGISIAIAYLEQQKIANCDINIWIN